MIIESSLEKIYRQVMRDLQDPDFESSPRGKPIRELLVQTFELTDPRNRLVLSPARAANYGFAVGELCWYLRGDTDLATMLYYNRRMGQFSDDGKTINSAYGARLFNERWQGLPDLTCVPVGQFDNVVQELKGDPDSRRAVMHINQPHDLRRAVTEGSKDVPCTMSLQLFIRDRRLHMHVLMRSNDVVWGLPYDVFSFTCLQEVFLYKLQEAGVPVDDLGSYHHTAGSLHVYAPHYDMAEAISKEMDPVPAPMKPFTLAGIEFLAAEDEPGIREDDWADIIGTRRYSHDEYSIGWMYSQLVDHKNKRIREESERLRREEHLREITRLSEENDVEQT